MANSSARYEDLGYDLQNLKEKIKARLKQKITEGTLNGLTNEGDGIVLLMKKEVDMAPLSARDEMRSRWSLVNGEWATFKRSCRQGAEAFDQEIPTGFKRAPQEQSQLNRATGILERTGQSVFRATQVAQESELIGTEVVNELGVQREALVRTRERLVDTNQDLGKTHKVLRSMNRRVLTNKLMLIIIIIMEVAILLGLVYWKFIMKRN